MIKVMKLVVGCAVLCALPSLALAYPSSICVVPSTDVIGANTFSLGYESEGHNQPFAETTQANYVYTQFGVTDVFEFGVDVYGVGDTNVEYLNAKYLVAPETDDLPAVAVGIMNVADGMRSSFYAVGSRTFGPSKLFFGVQAQGDNNSVMGGVSYAINSKFTAVADYQSARFGAATIGLCWQANKSLCVTVYDYVKNDRDTSDLDYLGLNLTYKLSY